MKWQSEWVNGCKSEMDCCYKMEMFTHTHEALTQCEELFIWDAIHLAGKDRVAAAEATTTTVSCRVDEWQKTIGSNTKKKRRKKEMTAAKRKNTADDDDDGGGFTLNNRNHFHRETRNEFVVREWVNCQIGDGVRENGWACGYFSPNDR